MAHKTKTVAVHNVFLDNENPRHDPIDNEPEIIQRLASFEGVAALAADMAQFGLSPLDRMAVVEHESQRGKYVVVEGNRRLCSIKLLTDPEKAPNERLRKTFRKLRAKIKRKLPQDLEVVEFSDRAAARHWLELRHEGPQKGAGTKAWNAGQRARFNAGGKGDNPNALALLLVTYAENRGLIDSDERRALNLTTLTRYLSNPVFRNTLGLASNRELRIKAKPAAFDLIATRFLKDSLKAIQPPVNSRSNKSQREAYADTLRTEGYAPAPAPVTALNAANANPAANAKATRQGKHPRDRARVIPADFRVAISDRVFKRVFRELKDIDAGEFSFAANYLVRAVLELAVKRYCTKYGIPFNSSDLHITIQRVGEDLVAKGLKNDRVLKPLRVMANNKDAPYSPDTLGNIVHGGAVASRGQINDNWDSMSPGLLEILNRL